MSHGQVLPGRKGCWRHRGGLCVSGKNACDDNNSVQNNVVVNT
jgi:hypothetical protein